MGGIIRPFHAFATTISMSGFFQAIRKVCRNPATVRGSSISDKAEPLSLTTPTGRLSAGQAAYRIAVSVSFSRTQGEGISSDPVYWTYCGA